MSDLLELCSAVLKEAGFATRYAEMGEGDEGVAPRALAFEDDTVLGFVVAYDSVVELIERWKSDGDRVAMRHRDLLQSARQKAWNAYLVLIARDSPDFGQALALGQIEEDLTAMRKIARAGVSGASGVRSTLLTLLPFRAAPSLDPIDMRVEIEARTTELDPQVVKAFLSGAEEAIVVQSLEDHA